MAEHDTPTAESGAHGDATGFAHVSVMLDEIVEVLSDVPDGIVVDATLGGAGHAAALLAANDGISSRSRPRIEMPSLAASNAAACPAPPRVASTTMPSGTSERTSTISSSMTDTCWNSGALFSRARPGPSLPAFIVSSSVIVTAHRRSRDELDRLQSPDPRRTPGCLPGRTNGKRAEYGSSIC